MNLVRIPLGYLGGTNADPGLELKTTLKKRKFQSARLIGSYEKPWLGKKDPRMFWDRCFFWAFTLVGIGLGAYIIYTGWTKVENPPVCDEYTCS